MRVRLLALGAAALALTCAGVSAEPRVIFLSDSLPGSSEAFASQLKDGISKAGMKLRLTRCDSLSRTLDAEQERGSILVLPNAVSFPMEAKGSLVSFLKRGGHLLAVSGPAFADPVVRCDDGWVAMSRLGERLARLPGRSVIDFAKEDLASWERATPVPQNRMVAEVVPAGIAGVEKALHVRYDKFEQWEVYQRSITAPFKDGENTTILWAKAGAGTPVMRLQWTEKDGSRWIATLKLTREWKRYALLASDFQLWRDGVPAGRGGAGDRFNPANADRLTLVQDISPELSTSGRPRELWVADLRVAAFRTPSLDASAPVLESISPAYKTYRTKADRIELTGRESGLTIGAEVTCPAFRSRGLGSDALRKWRFIPLLRVIDAKGADRGAWAHLFVNSGPDYRGSVWGYIGLDQSTLEKHAASIVPEAVSMLKRMSSGMFLANAGSDMFCYVSGEKTLPGAYVLNAGVNPFHGTVEFAVTNDGLSMAGSSAQVDAASGSEPVKVDGKPATLPAGEYRADAKLIVDGQIVDRISHPFRVVGPSKPLPSEIVTAHDGDFWLNGRQWYPLGINYWPSFSAGLEAEELYTVHWLGPQQYDPEAVEADLALAERLKMNSVSIQYYRTDQARPLMDFLARAEKHGIKVNAFVEGLHPLDYNMWSGQSGDMLKVARELIAAAHLAESPAVYAYDLGWEVHVGPYADRVRFDKAWQGWVVDMYGSVESAVADWGFSPELREGVLTGPSDDQLRNDGEWRRFVAAYRRFWDDEISKRYRMVRESLREIDPVHLAAARSGYGGTGGMGIVYAFPFDLASGAKHLDFISPEAYAISNSWDEFLKGGFNTAYSRFVSGGKPVFWAEYGLPVVIGVEWMNYRHGVTPERQDAEAEYYERMVEMNYITGASGSAGWWWPGGYRLVENSDYGIINPDGTPRAAALAMEKAADRFLKPRPVKAGTVDLTIDRDKFVTGYAGVLADGSGRFAELLKSGKLARLVTEGTGTTSANTPLVAVGNVPCNGHNPPKYLNAEFNWVRVNGQSVANGSIVEVAKGESVIISASIGNIGEALWLAPKGDGQGSVYLVASSAGSQWERGIAADAPFLGDGAVDGLTLSGGLTSECEVTLRMQSKGRTPFGEVFRIRFAPK